jgi:signal transduction histidine kinase
MLQITPVACQPLTVVKQIQQIFDAELQSKKIDMQVVQHPTITAVNAEWVKADPSRISQILINLLSNAIKFLTHRPERRIVVTVAASTEPPQGAGDLPSVRLENDTSSKDMYLYFSIMDTGPGIPQADMATLFKKFSQATPRTHVAYGGSGLGLFISKRLVELQSGQIHVSSKEGSGSTFSFFIKVERCTRLPSNVTPPVIPLPVVPGDSKTHVLVVEVPPPRFYTSNVGRII